MENTERILTRDCEAIRIPSGETFTLPAGARVSITQALGGSYTVALLDGYGGLARITDSNADALGEQAAGKGAAPAVAPSGARVEEKSIWEQLKTCYDPEIPVNIVDLGLVYDCVVEQSDGQPASVQVKMTLTAPGCGMGPTIAAEARAKIETIPGVGQASVDLVWDPPWSQAMISEAGKMKLGLI
jgi:probable FeS assembly SUF system protein SufT